MKTRFAILLLAFPVIIVAFTGCSLVSAIMNEVPNQGVVVVNTMPNTRLNVVAQAVYGRETFGKGIIAGTQCYVPAALFPQSQTIVVTVHAYDLEGNYLGSRSRTFGFSNPGGGNYQNQEWDVQKQDLAKN